ncbi:VOC family protein [Kerstersia gyiorum]|uniref:VOC family protein n=1 Tax=Kerstersia gyiorum TaxID=206506 RepID=UPI0039EA0A01
MNPSIIQSITFGRTAPCLPVRNIQAALAFYSGVLGFQKTFENGDPVGFVVLKKDAAEIHLSQNREHLATRMNALHMFVDDIDALYQLCVSARVRIIKSLSDKDYGQHSCLLIRMATGLMSGKSGKSSPSSWQYAKGPAGMNACRPFSDGDRPAS